MKKDIIVEILRFGKDNNAMFPLGVTREEVRNHLISLGFTLNPSENLTFEVIFGNCYRVNVIQPEQRFHLTADSHFTLLEYDELEEARNSSKQANIWAVIALTISIIGTGISIYFNIKQIDAPTEIKQSQIDQLITSSQNPDKQIVDFLNQDKIKLEKLYVRFDSLLKVKK